MAGSDETAVMRRDVFTFHSYHQQQLFAIVCDGLDLVQKLWPKPPSATVTLEMHDWIRLRRVLLALPDLWLEVSDK